MEFVSVVNWNKFQHYGDRRSPPWIRLYNSLIENYRWGLLSDVSKAHLIGLFLLASRTSNRIPADPAWIAQRIQAREPVNLSELLENGFIVPALAVCGQSAGLEERRVEEIRTEVSGEVGRAPVSEWRGREPSTRGLRSAGAVGKALMLEIAQEEGLL